MHGILQLYISLGSLPERHPTRALHPLIATGDMTSTFPAVGESPSGDPASEPSNGIESSQHPTSVPSGPHFLESEWVMWEHRAPDKNSKSYEDNMAKLVEVRHCPADARAPHAQGPAAAALSPLRSPPPPRCPRCSLLPAAAPAVCDGRGLLERVEQHSEAERDLLRRQDEEEVHQPHH